MALSVLAVPVLFTMACGGETGAVGPAVGSSGSSGGASGGGSGTGSEDPGGPRLSLALRGSIAPVTHADAFSGQTPSAQIVAIKSLWLYTSPADPNPVKVLDLGAKAVDADLVTGVASEIGTVAIRSLPAGTYTMAKVGTAYVRYSVAARLHGPVTVDGRYDNVQALSNGAIIDGVARQKGWYRYAFAVGDTPYGVIEGENAPVPQVPGSGGISLDSAGGDSFYVFPTLVVIDPTVTVDQRVVCDVNVHESFRWQDQDLAGYAPKVYDTTPTSFEPVMVFGANSLSLTLEPK